MFSTLILWTSATENHTSGCGFQSRARFKKIFMSAKQDKVKTYFLFFYRHIATGIENFFICRHVQKVATQFLVLFKSAKAFCESKSFVFELLGTIQFFQLDDVFSCEIYIFLTFKSTSCFLKLLTVFVSLTLSIFRIICSFGALNCYLTWAVLGLV